MNKPGWNDGCAVIYDNQFVRNNIEGEIIGLTKDLSTNIDNRLLAYELFG